MDNSLDIIVALLPVMKMSQLSLAWRLRRVCSKPFTSCTSSINKKLALSGFSRGLIYEERSSEVMIFAKSSYSLLMKTKWLQLQMSAA